MAHMILDPLAELDPEDILAEEREQCALASVLFDTPEKLDSKGNESVRMGYKWLRNKIH